MPPTPRTENVNLAPNLSEGMEDVINDGDAPDGLPESFEVQADADIGKADNRNIDSAFNPDANLAKKDEDDSYEYATKTSCLCFVIEYCSNFFFLVASSLYVALAFQGLHSNNKEEGYESKKFVWETLGEGIPFTVLYAEDDVTWEGWSNETNQTYYDYFGNYTWNDDWDDDYAFKTVDSGVTIYQTLYFCAAVCYIINGVFDFILEPGFLGVLLVMAGGFGVGSACVLESNQRLAIILNSVSVHLFLLEAVGLFCTRSRVASRALKWFIRFGGICWIVGTSMDVGFSYVYLFKESSSAVYPVWILIGAICSAFLWLISAIVTSITTCCIQLKPGLVNANRAYIVDKEARSFDEEESPASPLSAKDSMAF
mmetsp:Transcript_7071/g.10317  ORF Transcript_7071/g.10317 Transcript_7071/m.10317 type:complete len:370 (-) Transcript_7071:1468-2577(-)